MSLMMFGMSHLQNNRGAVQTLYYHLEHKNQLNPAMPMVQKSVVLKY